MTPPIILVQDWTSQPALTTRYVCEENDLDLQSVFTKLSHLLRLPPCKHYYNPDLAYLYGWPCTPCQASFSELFWSATAQLIDYFADFVAIDTPTMHSIWFHMLDMWQECAMWLPYAQILENPPPASHRLVIQKAKEFSRAFNDTLRIMQIAAFGPVKQVSSAEEAVAPMEAIAFPPSGDAEKYEEQFNTGPWISGLKPWQQFLSAGSPGVAMSSYSELESEATTHDDDQVEELTRYIPMPAIAIIQKHTYRARGIASKLFASNHDAYESTNLLKIFDNYSLQFPTKKNRIHAYTSLTGKTTTYSLRNGAPPISRYSGLADPQMTIEDPDFTVLDEFVGICKGFGPYAPVSGASGDGDDDEEEGDDESDEDVDSDDEDDEEFDIWAVQNMGWDLRGGRGWSMVDGLGNMFDEWHHGEVSVC